MPDSRRIQELVDRPGESLAVEMKAWLNPEEPIDQAKIVRGVLALRNHGGGFLLVGFNDDPPSPDFAGAPAETHERFHVDKIQGLISRFASDIFEIAVEFGTREGIDFPVLAVPPGVRVPVAAKSDLVVDGRTLIAAGDVYVRTLRSNNTPSTSKAGWQDWEPLVNTCFENREADIGRFLRRHLGADGPAALQALAAEASSAADPQAAASSESVPALNAQPPSLALVLDKGRRRFEAIAQERRLTVPAKGFWEVALVIRGAGNPLPLNSEFLNLLSSSNPNLTGWPVWLDSRPFSEKADRPFVNEGGWEAFIFAPGDVLPHVEFMRLTPSGEFYLIRALQDDLSSNAPKSPPQFDFGMPVIRCAEAISVGIAFAKAMGYKPEETVLRFAFRWTGLAGRELSSWAERRRFLSGGRFAYQDEVTIELDVPLDIAPSAIGALMSAALKPLYSVFDGFELNNEVAEDLTSRVLNRRL